MNGLACLGLAQALEMELLGHLVALLFFIGEESQEGKEGGLYRAWSSQGLFSKK